MLIRTSRPDTSERGCVSNCPGAARAGCAIEVSTNLIAPNVPAADSAAAIAATAPCDTVFLCLILVITSSRYVARCLKTKPNTHCGRLDDEGRMGRVE